MHNITRRETIAAAQVGASSDRGSKVLWNNKEIIAPFLYMLIPEFKGMSTKEVLSYMDSNIQSEEVSVDDLHLIGKDTAVSSLSEKGLYFDKYFTVRNPRYTKVSKKNRISVYLHIDLEMQKSYRPTNPSYQITKRAIYYGARALDRQLPAATKQTNYDALEKVYSVWICDNNVPKKLQNTVSMYSIKRDDIIGVCNESDALHDLITIIIVRLGAKPSKEKIFDYIDSVFTADIPRMQQYSDVQWPEELRKEANDMITSEDYVGWRREEKGRIEGRLEGENRLASLLSKLYAADRASDVEKAVHDAEFRNTLYKEFNMQVENKR